MSFPLQPLKYIEMRVHSYLQSTSQLAVNTIRWWIASSSGGTYSSDVLASQFDVTIASLWKDCLCSDAKYLGLTLQDFPLRVFVPSWSNANLGAGAFDLLAPLPGGVSGLVSFKTNWAGSAGQGRLFIPFPSEGASGGTTGRPGVGYVEKLSAIGTYLSQPRNFTDGPRAIQLRMMISAASGVPVDDVPKLVSSFVAQAKWGTQRRRSDFGRQNPVPAFFAGIS